MNRFKVALFALVLSAALAVSGCSFFTSKNINTALDAVQLACVFSNELTDEKAVATICGVADDLIPIVKQLIAQREAAKRSGVHWGVSDAGAQ